MANQLNDCKWQFYLNALNEAFTDGSFDIDPANSWQVFGSGVTFSNGNLVYNGSSNDVITQQLAPLANTDYLFSVKITNIVSKGANNPRAQWQSVGTYISTSYNAASDTYTAIVTSGADTSQQNFFIELGAFSSGGQYDIEYVSLRPVDSTLDTNHINDLEVLWLQAQGATSNHIMDAWDQYFDLQNIAAGMHNDRKFAWLGAMGFTGTLNDRELAFYCGVTPSGDFSSPDFSSADFYTSGLMSQQSQIMLSNGSISFKDGQSVKTSDGYKIGE